VISIVLNENIVHNLRNHLCQTNTVREHDANHLIVTSGSFGEGLEMKGSDVDMMVVFSNVDVYEKEKKEGHVIIVNLFLSCS
jgi:predicted nucleotidyltransferase